MKAGQLVRLVKMDRVLNGEAPSNSHAHSYGQGRESLPIGYLMEGILQKDIVVGHGVHLFRTKRSGPDETLVDAPGVMTTSKVTEIDQGFTGVELYTQNSIYILNVIE